MKFAVFCTLFLLISLASFTQIDQEESIKQKIVHYEKMQKKGRTFQIIGGTTIVAGIVMAAKGEWSCYSGGFGGSCSPEDPFAIIGSLCILTGITVGTIGIVNSSIANKRRRQYHRMLENLSVEIMPGSKVVEFQLVCKF